MELRIPTLEQLRTVYDRDLRTAFPAAELKPLKNMEEMWAEGRYRPWCLVDGDDIAGEAFLWLGHPGWALLDYLCVAADRRNGGLGSVILEKLREAERGNVIFGESEIPCYAPDPAMAERRLGFYARNPKFAKKYANIREDILKGAAAFVEECHNGAYPAPEHSYTMLPGEEEKLLKMLAERG